MNTTKHLIKTSSHLTRYDIFELYGSTWLRDVLCVFVLAPLSAFGAFFNLISMIILYRKKFKSRPLYTYLKVFTLNSLGLNLIEMGLTSVLSFRFMEFSYKSPLPSYFMCYFYIPFMNVLVLYGIVLEIYISFERNSQFSAKFKYLLNYNPVKVCLVTFLACFLINIQHFFVGKPVTEYHVIKSSHVLKINYFNFTKFSVSLSGIIINSIVYIFRDVVLFVVQIVFNLITIVLLKNHLNNKNIILKRTKQHKEPLLLSSKSTETTHATKIEPTFRNIKHVKIKKYKSISKVDQNLSIMFIVMTFFTAFEHLFLLAMIYLVTFHRTKKSVLFAMVANIVISFKHASNFFLYLLFNKVFRVEFKKFIGIDSEI